MAFPADLVAQHLCALQIGAAFQPQAEARKAAEERAQAAEAELARLRAELARRDKSSS